MLRIEVNDNQTEELRRAARQAVGRVSERIHFVLMSAHGRSVDEIGRVMNYDPKTVTHWLHAYADGGLAALDDAPRSGRPKKAADLTDGVETQAGQPPTVYGYLQAVWTVGRRAVGMAPGRTLRHPREQPDHAPGVGGGALQVASSQTDARAAA